MKNIQFEWDENKNAINLSKHGLDFRDAHLVFAREIISVQDTRADYGEERYASLGLLEARCVFIAHTKRASVIRIISMRKANVRETKIYTQQFS
jgi:uncharacterized protein